MRILECLLGIYFVAVVVDDVDAVVVVVVVVVSEVVLVDEMLEEQHFELELGVGQRMTGCWLGTGA